MPGAGSGVVQPELNYIAIRSVVRWARFIPPCVGLATLAVLLLFSWRLDAFAWLVAAVIASPLAWFGARLLVEIVAVVADTLLPR